MKNATPIIDPSKENVLCFYSLSSEYCGHIAELSNILRDFTDRIKAHKRPPKPRLKLDLEYPCHLHGKPLNFEVEGIATLSGTYDLGFITSVRVAYDNQKRPYLQLETPKGFYFAKI